MDTLSRRTLLQAGTAAATLAMLPRGLRAGAPPAEPRFAEPRFGLHYAPHLGMFRHLAGDDPLDQVRFMADQGFTAFEDNGMKGRPVELQEKIGKLLDELGMTMGVFVAHSNAFGKPSFSSGDTSERERFVADLKESVEVAQRVGATWTTVVPGTVEPRLPMDYQTANAIEALRRGAEVYEPAGLVMVLEALNPWRDHPGMFLAEIPQAYMICRAVDSPACKILFDVYHQQITEGNLIPNFDRAWDEIAYIQVGDTPGRKQPTTGEINYANLFRHLKEKGWDGVIGMEHGNWDPGAEGEQAVIDAYRAVDPA